MNTGLINRHSVGVSDFDKIFNSVFGLANSTRVRHIAVDVIETNDKFEIKAELPGYSPDQVKVRVEDDNLIIESDVKEEKTTTEEKYLIKERFSSQFRRSFALPKEVDQEHIEANFKDGLLTLTVPKTEKAKPREIVIK